MSGGTGVSSAITGERSFRPDIEGLRAVAVLLVVAFHAGLGLVAGGFVGVDVFFVLSGFLITGLLVDELRRTGTISLPTFYARRARRLLPMAAVVLVATAALSRFLLPPLDHPGITADIRAAALYFANWHFAAGATDYMSDPDKSPVLHFWSLSVEEQFYLAWPLLLLAVASVVRVRGGGWPTTRRYVWAGLAVLGSASLVLSVTTSQSSGPYGYFGLHTRAWELAAGAALALARPALRRVPPRLAATAGWTGLALVVGGAVGFGRDTVFPGTAALVPVGGTVLLVVAGSAGPASRVTRALSTAPMTYVGRRSYAWYLWHWPLLVFATHRYADAVDPETGVGGDLPVLPALVAVLLSFGAAALSHHLLENPVRRSAWLTARRTTTLSLATALSLLAVLASAVSLSAGPPDGNVFVAASRALGGETLSPDNAADRAVPGPQEPGPPRLTMQDVARARDDKPRGTRGCYLLDYESATVRSDCVYGDTRAARSVVLLGDSQAQQWLPALDRLGQQRHWRVYLWAKASCPFNDVAIWLTRYKGDYSACRAWRGNVLAHLRVLPRVDLVLLSRSRAYSVMAIRPDGHRAGPRDVGRVWARGSARTSTRLQEVARTVGFLHATPSADTDVPACLSEHLDDVAACAFPREEGTHDDLFAAEGAAARRTGARLLDLTPAICSADPCPVVTPRGVVMLRDVHHLTARYSRAMAGRMGAEIDRAAPVGAGRPGSAPVRRSGVSDGT